MQKIKRPVYNESQKLEFIKYATNNEKTIVFLINLFRSVAPYEFKKNADISTFHADELSRILEDICGVRTRSRFSKKSMLQNYIQWCVNTGKSGAIDETKSIVINSDDRIKASLIRNPEHLQVRLNSVFDREDECTRDNTFRFFFWMAYGGMPEEKILLLTAKDINIPYMEANKGDDIAILYRQGLPAIHNCIELKSFLYKNEAYTNAGDIWRDRVPGDTLMRGVRGNSDLLAFRVQLSRKLKIKRDAGIDTTELTYSRVWLSGVFYRLYEKELAGVIPNFSALAMESPNVNRILKRGQDQAKRKTLEAIEYGYRSDYERWKSVNAL